MILKKCYSLKKNISVLKNNKGVTLVEMITTFALLALFMVAATRVISYVIGIYYAARGTSYGLEVTNMITNKIVGQIEGASTINSFVLGEGENEEVIKVPVIFNNSNGIDELKFVDSKGSVVTYSIDDETHVLNIHYDQTANYDPKEGTGYAATDWYFDPDAYMGYTITRFDFEKAGDLYPDNVIRMDIEVDSPKYGEFESAYYIKCFNVEEVLVK